MKVASFFTLAITGSIVVLAGSFTQIFLGDKWLSAVVPIQLLALAGGIYTVGMLTMPLYLGMGKPRVVSIINSIGVALLVLISYPFVIKLGVPGAAIAYLLSSCISSVMLLYFSSRVLAVPFMSIVSLVFYPALMLVAVIAAGSYVGEISTSNEYLRFALILLTSMVTVVASALLMDKRQNFGLWSMMKDLFIELFRGSRK